MMTYVSTRFQRATVRVLSTVDLCIKSTLDITILERRFALVLDKMHLTNPLAESLDALLPLPLYRPSLLLLSPLP